MVRWSSRREPMRGTWKPHTGRPSAGIRIQFCLTCEASVLTTEQGLSLVHAHTDKRTPGKLANNHADHSSLTSWMQMDRLFESSAAWSEMNWYTLSPDANSAHFALCFLPLQHCAINFLIAALSPCFSQLPFIPVSVTSEFIIVWRNLLKDTRLLLLLLRGRIKYSSCNYRVSLTSQADRKLWVKLFKHMEI